MFKFGFTVSFRKQQLLTVRLEASRARQAWAKVDTHRSATASEPATAAPQQQELAPHVRRPTMDERIDRIRRQMARNETDPQQRGSDI